MPRRRRPLMWTGMALLAIAGGVAWYLTRVSPEAAALRQKFAYVSLSDRLSYEARHIPEDSDHDDPIFLGPTLKRLDAAEDPSVMAWNGARMESLRKLHSREATRFVNSQGNGITRLGLGPDPRWLEYYENRTPVAFPVDTPESTGESGDHAVALSEQDVQEDAGGAWNPSLNLLGDFHSEEQFKFANPSTYGHVKDRDHVAGFVSHGFSKLPVLKHPQNDWIKVQGKSKSVESHPAAWKIVRLELVSLLKFDEPAVYVSDHLPQMSELADAKTRPLTPFEEQALESLQAGEYLVAAADTNHIRMLGSLRASKQCLECHAGRRGTLLGAFSYRLRRDPPLSVTTSGKKPAT